jgi:hypothetical protein
MREGTRDCARKRDQSCGSNAKDVAQRAGTGISRISAPTAVSSKVRLTLFKLWLMSPLSIVVDIIQKTAARASR